MFDPKEISESSCLLEEGSLVLDKTVETHAPEHMDGELSTQ